MNEPERSKKGWRRLQWGVIVFLALVGALMWQPLCNEVLNTTYQQRQARKGQSILFALRVFANDNSSRYPDSFGAYHGSANKAFRGLLSQGVVEDERIFGGEISPFYGDRDHGQAPNFEKAVGPGENHWMMLGALSSHSHPTQPLIFENALKATWPPKWVVGSERRPIRGRTWHRGVILVGLNDGSLVPVKTTRSGDELSLPESMTRNPASQFWDKIEVLDVESRLSETLTANSP
jgi:hypothetical protein